MTEPVAPTVREEWKRRVVGAIGALDSPRLPHVQALLRTLHREPADFQVIPSKQVRDARGPTPVPASVRVYALRSFLPVDTHARRLSGQGIPEVAVAAVPLELGPQSLAVVVPAVVSGTDASGTAVRSEGAVVEVYASLVSGPVEVAVGRSEGSPVLVHLTPDGAVCAFHAAAQDALVLARVR